MFTVTRTAFATGLAGLTCLTGLGSPALAATDTPAPTLRIEGDVLSGVLADGAYSVQIGTERATGVGPLGPVDISFEKRAAGYEIDGVWNGGRIHFSIDEDRVTGRAVRPITSGDFAYGACRFDLGRAADSLYAGVSQCLGEDTARHFEVRLPGRDGLWEQSDALLLVAYLAAPSRP